ncbi:hypothetical protein BS47DRAFT_92513 [Hydnum rufescens UP504]|uniref:Uncharacterized protein n=1 Tax=Hydnum rufescens UP504 TaxID=1448309 RepID=A0A9P6ARS8_9AGAM|nr:hypothetical protein BS47DRAFT_92513 [Hydnum rufescens UP504]
MPSVRVKKNYATLPEPSDGEGSPDFGTGARQGRGRSRSATVSSVFRNSRAPSDPGDQGPNIQPPSSSLTPAPGPQLRPQTKDDGNATDAEDDGRSWVSDAIARRRLNVSSTASDRPGIPHRVSAPLAVSADNGQASSSPSFARHLAVPGAGIPRPPSRSPSNPSLTAPPNLADVALARRASSPHLGVPQLMTLQVPTGTSARTEEQPVAELHDPFTDETPSSEYSSDDDDSESEYDDEEHHLDDVVEHLDVIDPQVAVVSHLSNAANSILIPRLPIYSRRPVVTLPTLSPSDTFESLPDTEGAEKAPRKRRKTEDELDAHVEHVLKRRARIRRTLRGLGQFLMTPTGIVVGIYGFLVVFWGAAIVFFLAKFINLHNPQQQKFWIEISSQVENALFTVTGVGLIPWRLMDTYRILFIWHYKRLDARLRMRLDLPPLQHPDDLPDPQIDPNFTHVLTEKQQKDLRRQQREFAKSQTWYRPHSTDTHRAFPIGTALLICLLVDGNSFFQCILCGTMWGLNEYNRPPWTTGLLIPASFLCGIGAAVIIARGGSKTKRRAEVEERLRVALNMEKNGDRRGLIHDFTDQQHIVYNRTGREVNGLIMIPPRIGEADEDDAEHKGNAVVQVFGGRAGHIP